MQLFLLPQASCVGFQMSTSPHYIPPRNIFREFNAS